MSLGNLTKLPAMVLALEIFQEVFVMLFVFVVFTSLEVFHFIAFRPLPSPFLELSLGLLPFYTLSPVHCRVIRDTFILTFLGFSFLPLVLRF